MSSIDLADAVIAGADGPAPVAGEGSLRITVRDAIPLNGSPSEVAVAATLAVADWLEDKAGDLGSVQPEWWIAQMLRREVGQ